MVSKFRNTRIALLLLFVTTALLQVKASCTKSNNNSMTGQSSNSIPPADTLKTYLALGDSYTIGESIEMSGRYPIQAVTALRKAGIAFADPEIIATTGWTTADLQHAISKKEQTPAYDIVTLLIGVNNQYQGKSVTEYTTQFTSLLNQSIALAGNRPSHVIVISIPDYAVTSFGESTGNAAYISSQINVFNAINKQVSLISRVNYVDITSESRKTVADPTLVAHDGLHYSAKEYAIWAALIVQQIESILK
jgi:lysophospholipase L1-like esterase